jgi:hypothetical protein
MESPLSRRVWKLANQKQVFPKAAMFSNGSGRNDAMSNRYRGPSIDVSYQVSFHLAKRFHKKRLKCEKLTDDGRQLMAKAISCLQQEYLNICLFQYLNYYYLF